MTSAETAWTRPTCCVNSGSMYGNVPLCDQPATHVVVHRNGRNYGPPVRTPVCGRHLAAKEGTAYPGHIQTEPLTPQTRFSVYGPDDGGIAIVGEFDPAAARHHEGDPR